MAHGHSWRDLARAVIFVTLLGTLAGCSGISAASTARATTTPTIQAPTPTPTPLSEPPSPPPHISARAALLMDATTGNVLFSKNANTEMAMASTTKIMTAIVALTYATPAMPITIGADAAAMNNGEDSVAYLRKGDTITLSDLLYALMLPSGDDAAVAIADGVAGSQANFVHLMNLEAFLLGLHHTHYANVHGLDAAGHYTTAADLARLTRFAMRNWLFAHVVGTATYTLPATTQHATYTWTNTNELVWANGYPGSTGVKTGFTGNAGYCLVFSARRNGASLLGVVLGEPAYEARFTDAAALLDWGFGSEGRSTGTSG